MITDMICFMNLYDIYDIVLIVCSCTWLLNVSVKVSSSQITEVRICGRLHATRSTQPVTVGHSVGDLDIDL